MGIKELLVNLKGYDAYEIKAYQLQRDEGVLCSKALEKQLEKKPYSCERAERTISGFCPSCNTEVHYLVRPIMRSFCPHCGQKLDWTE